MENKELVTEEAVDTTENEVISSTWTKDQVFGCGIIAFATIGAITIVKHAVIPAVKGLVRLGRKAWEKTHSNQDTANEVIDSEAIESEE